MINNNLCGFSKRRYLYISNAFEANEKDKRLITGDSPAASGKVIGLCRAVRSHGGKASIISLGRGRQRGSWEWYPSVIRRVDGVPIVYAACLDAPIVSHLVSTISLLFVVIKIMKRESIAIYYNYLPHYVPCLISNRIMKRRCILDLEDGHRSDEKTLRGRINRYLLAIYNLLCNGGVMLASSSLIKQTSLRPFCICYGVVPSVNCITRWKEQPLQVLYGGQLCKDTGVDLFLESLAIIIKKGKGIKHKLRIVITGFGDMSVYLENEVRHKYNDFVEYRGALSKAEYIQLLRESHVGLSLRIPGMLMSTTTFPSKVVEMAAFGLLVVSTRVSDVPLLFSEKTGVLLNNASPEDLAAVLLSIVDSPETYRDIALQGQRELSSLLSPQRVGAELLNFWNGSDSLCGLE